MADKLQAEAGDRTLNPNPNWDKARKNINISKIYFIKKLIDQKLKATPEKHVILRHKLSSQSKMLDQLLMYTEDELIKKYK